MECSDLKSIHLDFFALSIIFGLLWSGYGTSTTYSYTGSAQSVTVPSGVNYMTVQLYGAGSIAYNQGQSCGGGFGGYAKATFSVTPGTTIFIYVGGLGAVNLAGFNGGGSGPDTYGTGGSGATDIRTPTDSLNDRILVAGGGGGCYASASCTVGGGNAGYPSGFTGEINTCGTSGGGGTQTSGGIAGYSGGSTGGTGTLGVGGYSHVNYGAGGGGGYYGGGGGATAGGGGGSGYVSSTGTDSSFVGSWSGDGKAIIEFTFVSSPPSSQPSSQPSGHPSSHPKSQPFAPPSRQPSIQPTIQPSGKPSSQPSSRPSGQPSV